MAQPQHQMPQMPQPAMPQMQHQMQQVPQMQQHHQMQHSPQMAPQIPQMQRTAFSPTQHSPSPTGTPQPQFTMPPNKRPRTETGPVMQQQQQAYLSQQQYASSPQNQATSPSVASPNYAPSPSAHLPQNYASPYANGAAPLSMPTPTSTTTPVATPTLHLPDGRQSFTPSPSTPAGPLTPNSQYTTATMMPIAPPPPPIPGVMGPPSKPADRPTKEFEYGYSDSLTGTGIDLRAEEQYLADLFQVNFAQEARTGFPANDPGSKASMYGAGLANQPAQVVDGVSQDQFAVEAAQRAWDEAAQRLAISRSNEMKEPFVQIPQLHSRAEKIAKEHGISLNLDLRNAGSMGKLKHPLDFPQPKVTVTTRTGPDGAMVSTKGSWIPHDAFLADQLALLSIAAKHRIRDLLEEVAEVASLRQTSSNGEIPDEWVDVAVPLQTGLESLAEPESAVSPHANPLKRSFGAALGASSAPPKLANHITKAIRDSGESDRKVEDARLKKRQKRANPDPAAAGSRSGSVAPGTPGSVAPEAETTKPAKKDKKGAAAARMAEASSTASANQTLSTMMGGFGGRKKGKQYSWMTSGGSGANTPNRMNTPGTPGGVAPGTPKAVQEARLTLEGKTRWGTWRESIQGKSIQLRDLVTVLEMSKLGFRAMQGAYAKLDTSLPK
ncbi:hypothetical protein OQA88_6276 [Cercophora sp. LCS_1]